VRVVQRRSQICFAVETFAKVVVLRDLDGKDLQCIEARKARVLDEVHLAHAACSEAPSNYVPGKLLTFAQRHGAIVAGRRLEYDVADQSANCADIDLAVEVQAHPS
jgi:hypothetical protein